jgi:hypothetical protein
MGVDSEGLRDLTRLKRIAGRLRAAQRFDPDSESLSRTALSADETPAIRHHL